jgi:hypothetical protein
MAAGQGSGRSLAGAVAAMVAAWWRREEESEATYSLRRGFYAAQFFRSKTNFRIAIYCYLFFSSNEKRLCRPWQFSEMLE